jgi:hypothetical protein
MSGLTLRRSAPATADAGAMAGLSRYVTVDLLPPSVRDRRALQALRGKVGVGLVLVVLVIALGYVASIVNAAHASSLAAAAEDERIAIQQELASYSEVATIRSETESIRSAVTTVMESDVLWADQVRAVEAALPAGTVVASFAVEAVDGAAATSTPFTVDGAVGASSFTVTTPTLPDMAQMLDSLEAIPGVAVVEFTSSSIVDADGTYSTSGRIVFGQDALSGRYASTTDTTTEGAGS